MKCNMDWKTIIYQYSMKYTRNHWDAEELTQEAWLKLMHAIQTKPERPVSKAYLHTIVKNVWLDAQRKQKLQTIPMEPNEDAGVIDSSLDTRELLEHLAEKLPAKMAVILLLMDVLDFTAKETAVVVQMKEAAVQVALGRARKKLREAALQPSCTTEKVIVPGRDHYPADFDGLVDAFRRCDPESIYHCYIGLKQRGFQLTTLQSVGGRMQFTFCDPDGNLFNVTSE